MPEEVRAGAGLVVLILLGVLLSENRKAIPWRTVVWGIALQIILAIAVWKVPGVREILEGVAQAFVWIFEFARDGAEFLFGALVRREDQFGFIFAFQALPTIVFFSALSSVLFYLGILQKVIQGFAWLMRKTLRISGAEALVAAANVFVGQTEAPLLVRPYLERMPRSHLFTLMVSGMATIAGSVLAAYVGFLGGEDPAERLFFARHLLTASIISAPASIVFARLLIPEVPEERPGLSSAAEAIRFSGDLDRRPVNLLDAIARGTTDGLRLALNVGAMLIAFIAFVSGINFLLEKGPGTWWHLNEWVARWTGGSYSAFHLETILGIVFAPVSWLMGVPGDHILMVGQLIGEKTILNEFYAYVSLQKMESAGLLTDSYAITIAVYALCGFSNVGSIGIQLGGIGALIPGRRHELARMGWKAWIGGTLACLSTACVAGMLHSFIND